MVVADSIDTPRLLLRRWTMADADAIGDIYSDAQTMRWFGTSATFSREQLRDSLAGVIAEYATEGLGNFAIIEKSSSAIIGHCGLHRGHEPDITVELDCLITRDRWKLGYGTEATTAVLKRGFARWDTISAVAHSDNGPAIALMRRLGMSYVGKSVRFGFDSVLYEIHPQSFVEGPSAK